MSVQVIKHNDGYLPHFDGEYVNPKIPRAEREKLASERKEKIKEAFDFLSQLDTMPRKTKDKSSCCSSPFDNIFCNLATYMVTHPLAMSVDAFCGCFFARDPLDVKPIPRSAAETLEGTTRSFNRNVLGVCCIAPADIVATPFVKASDLVLKLLGIVSGLIITTTAGTNTYVFSGDIQVVPDGRGNLVVQGGIRVDAIAVITKAYSQISKWVKDEWKHSEEPKDRNNKFYLQCKKVCDNWDILFDLISDCGIRREGVEDILTPFTKALLKVIDEVEMKEGVGVDPSPIPVKRMHYPGSSDEKDKGPAIEPIG